MLITFNLKALFIKTRHVFKNKSLNKVLEHRDHKIFFNLTNKFSFTGKVQIALPRRALHPLFWFLFYLKFVLATTYGAMFYVIFFIFIGSSNLDFNVANGVSSILKWPSHDAKMSLQRHVSVKLTTFFCRSIVAFNLCYM